MNICEMFLSIEGEGKRTGQPAVFIRKTVCPLRCSYCDSAYTYEDNGTDMSVNDIMQELKNVGKGCKRVTFTGGEPLYYRNEEELSEIQSLIRLLTKEGYEVNIETNGSINLIPFTSVRKNGFFTMDWKSISSGMSRKMIPENLQVLNEDDILKFVVANEEDLNQMKSLINAYKPKAQVYVSPVFGEIDPKDIVEYVLDNNMFDAKVQLQLHKIIWDPEMRGV